jgi:hypothetical protein
MWRRQPRTALSGARNYIETILAVSIDCKRLQGDSSKPSRKSLGIRTPPTPANRMNIFNAGTTLISLKLGSSPLESGNEQKSIEID